MLSGAETLILTASYIAARLRPADYLEAVRQAFGALGAGRLMVPAVGHVPAARGAFHVKAAVAPASARAAIKINGNFPDNPALHGLPTVQGFIALLDAECGRVLALMDSIEITARRTAAASALAAAALARAQSAHLGLVGCGVQARVHLEALRELFPLSRVSCCDRDAERAAALAAQARAFGLDAQILADARAVARVADILVTCTPSERALVFAEDVRAGCFIAAVGADSPSKQELDPLLLKRARVVPDVLSQALAMGELRHAIAAGAMTAEGIHGELADIVCGGIAGRCDPNDVFVYDSTGSAIEDLAAAELAYAAACRDPRATRVELGS